jgi:hypothetical protein
MVSIGTYFKFTTIRVEVQTGVVFCHAERRMLLNYSPHFRPAQNSSSVKEVASIRVSVTQRLLLRKHTVIVFPSLQKIALSFDTRKNQKSILKRLKARKQNALGYYILR